METSEKEFFEQMDNVTFARDSEDDAQAIQFEKVAADIEIDLPDEIRMNNWKVLNQWPTQLCVAFWTTECVNESRHALWFTWDKNPNTLAWYIRENLDPDIDKNWTYVINWPNWARKLSWLEWYSQANSVYDLKKALALWMTIATWTNKVSWSATRKNNYIVVKWTGGWHFINIVWYNTKKENTIIWADWREYHEYFIIENTWWSNRGDNWCYYIPFEYALEVLFNTKKALLIEEAANRKYAIQFLENMRKEIEEKKITPVVKKYKYFDWEQFALSDQENKNLFIVLQNALNETKYKPIFRTIIWSNADRTNTRILLEISNARNYERNKLW